MTTLAELACYAVVVAGIGLLLGWPAAMIAGGAWGAFLLQGADADRTP